MEKGDVGSVLILLGVLGFAVIIVDERWLRFLIAVVPALLLAQQALHGSARGKADWVGAGERRQDSSTRDSIDELLRHIREFYLTCHLMGSGRMTSDEALEKAALQEKDLNRLLARVTDDARIRAQGSAGG